MQKQQLLIHKVNVVEHNGVKMGTIFIKSGSVVLDIVKDALKKLNAGFDCLVKTEVLRNGKRVKVNPTVRVKENEDLTITLDFHRWLRMDSLVEAVVFSKDNKQLTETVLNYAGYEIREQIRNLEDNYLYDDGKLRAYSQISDDVVGTIKRALLDCLQKVKQGEATSSVNGVRKGNIDVRGSRFEENGVGKGETSGLEIQIQRDTAQQRKLKKGDTVFYNSNAQPKAVYVVQKTEKFNSFLMTMNPDVLPVLAGVFTFVFNLPMLNVLEFVNSMIGYRGKDTCLIIVPSSQWFFSKRCNIKLDSIFKKGLMDLNETFETLPNIYVYFLGFPTDPLDVHFNGRLGEFNRICEQNAYHFGYLNVFAETSEVISVGTPKIEQSKVVA
ncbi:unnamed protein product [Bursaphelenchus okinawaensis]|uniref:Uncharacterized protein n=1 Tax=Bursaphelenchus okinawaensis TaxID=465554 RepID=A0A811JPX7_9BILA|nr:unnamed protein product [Bursaphelenchus okinawaensis]CAG9076847.1 unnamed protein product [Bursaphelenchus okinawaensis]